MIVKNITWSNWVKINKYIGIEADPIKDEREENFEMKNVINQNIIKMIPKWKLIANKIPRYVATPLPPLNFSQIGNTWPMKAHKEAMYKKSW